MTRPVSLWARQVHAEAQAVLDRLRERRATDALQAATNLDALAADVGGIRRAGFRQHRLFVGSIHDSTNEPARAEWTPALGRRVIGWRPCCTCSWQGAAMYRDRHDPTAPLWSDNGWPPPYVDGYAQGQWDDHLDHAREQLEKRPARRRRLAVAS